MSVNVWHPTGRAQGGVLLRGGGAWRDVKESRAGGPLDCGVLLKQKQAIVAGLNKHGYS